MTKAELVYIALGLMFVFPGLMALWVGVRGSRWFFDSRSYGFLTKKIGWGGARITMVIVGLLLLAAAVLVIVDPMGIMKGA
ncbi:hypothetical protein [uncultured Porphyromonas sp.]|uniref:hypothetical protein n=1 Tax=uncultured Porphyromonas sp. TaxID=159274 RepID=UPI002612900C|nr:hypothetical protein [uncultured Porphyromonas sp.]